MIGICFWAARHSRREHIIRLIRLQRPASYLGRAEAVNRERRSDQELRAGSLFPVIDQRIAGFANGTFDLVVRDAQAEDFASLQAQLGRVTPDQVDTTLVKVQP